MAGFTSYDVDFDKRFERIVKRFTKEIKDLRFPLTEAARVIKKFQTANFTLKGSGKYPALSPRYAARKKRLIGNQPIMVFNGRLKRAVIGRTSDSVLEVGKESLVVGEKTGYGIFHQSDAPRTTLPLRKFLFLTEQMVDQVVKIMVNYLLDTAEDSGFEVKK